MTADDRAKAVADFGFTERQARFLDVVMLHSGVCLQRQYAAFGGIVPGQKTRDFFGKLVSRGHAVAYPCRHNRGRVYHVRHKALYRAIGEANSGHRRPLSAAGVVRNLMLLDAVLATADVAWLASAERNARLSAVADPDVPIGSQTAGRVADLKTVRTFPYSMPIGIDATGRWVLIHLLDIHRLDYFRTFLRRQADVLYALPDWTLRVALPPPLGPPPNDVWPAAIAASIERGQGRVDYLRLPHQYGHLSPLVGSPPHGGKVDEEGDEAPPCPRPPLSSLI